MKKINFILSIIIILFVLISCEQEDYEPVINYGNGPVLTSSVNSGTFLLTEEEAENTLFSFTWTEADFGFQAAISYAVQMADAGSNFAKPIDLVTTSNLNYVVKVGSLNNLLLVKEYAAGAQSAFEIRVKASVSEYANALYSETLTFDIIPYSVKLPPIYLLGSGTTPGWDNANALPAPYWSPGVYGIAAHLKANEWIKFIHTLGAWAPQWGTDANGTKTGGNLVYRPDEATADPSAIPSPATEGDYIVVADIENLTYKVYPLPETVYLVGGATSIGWTPTNGIAFIKDDIGKYSLTTQLSAGNGGMKVMAGNSGAWAPQWGSDGAGTSLFGKLSYRPGDSAPDPAEIPAPEVAGTYKIELDFSENTYKVTKQ